MAAGLRRLLWDAMDEWYDEDERVEGHIRDPYHRVDVRRSSRPVRVRLGEEVLAETSRPLLLSETGLPNRFYIPAADVRQDLLEESDTHTVCAYKGTASYWTVSAGGRKLADAVWSYPQADGDAAAISGYQCFRHDELTTEVGRQENSQASPARPASAGRPTGPGQAGTRRSGGRMAPLASGLQTRRPAVRRAAVPARAQPAWPASASRSRRWPVHPENRPRPGLACLAPWRQGKRRRAR